MGNSLNFHFSLHLAHQFKAIKPKVLQFKTISLVESGNKLNRYKLY